MSTKSALDRLRLNKRGAVLVEYSFLLVAFGIPVVAAIAAGGVQMYSNYQSCRAAMLSGSP